VTSRSALKRALRQHGHPSALAPSFPGVLKLGCDRLRHLDRQVEQHLCHALAQRIHARRCRTTAGQRVMQNQVQRCNTRQVMAFDGATARRPNSTRWSTP
jgi:hypothetical protein